MNLGAINAILDDIPPLDSSWKIQSVFARDYFDDCTLTVTQWLVSGNSHVTGCNKMQSKWDVLMYICSLAWPSVYNGNGLRQEPRVGYDPVKDQIYFLFKQENDGNVHLVSPKGINLPAGEEWF